MIHFSALPELSLYIHLPWCVRKCPYCDFNSHEPRAEIPEKEYISALIADLESSLPLIWGRPIVSIFIGGGTPSLFSPESIDHLLAAVRARVSVNPGAEITLEANPGTFEADRFRGFAQAGVNRLSLGVQSFNDQQLGLLGRIHNADQAMKAAAMATQLFDQVNLDLMFGLPGQTISELQEDLFAALSFQTPHLSLYQLTIEPNTAFATRPPKPDLPNEDTIADMQALITDQTSQQGYTRYEISAYAKPGCESRHNLNYWTFGDYLGIGAGAHGKISFQDRIVRTNKTRHPASYMAAVDQGHEKNHVNEQVNGPGQKLRIKPEPFVTDRQLGVNDLAFEFMLNALRLTQGVAPARWQQTTGMAIGDHPFLLERLVQQQARGLMVAQPNRWRATAKGLDFLNDLQQGFL